MSTLLSPNVRRILAERGCPAAIRRPDATAIADPVGVWNSGHRRGDPAEFPYFPRRRSDGTLDRTSSHGDRRSNQDDGMPRPWRNTKGLVPSLALERSHVANQRGCPERHHALAEFSSPPHQHHENITTPTRCAQRLGRLADPRDSSPRDARTPAADAGMTEIRNTPRGRAGSRHERIGTPIQDRTTCRTLRLAEKRLPHPRTSEPLMHTKARPKPRCDTCCNKILQPP